MVVKILHLPILPLWACKVRRPRGFSTAKESQAARASLGVGEYWSLHTSEYIPACNVKIMGAPFQAVRGPASALTAGWGRWNFEMPCYYHNLEWDNV